MKERAPLLGGQFAAWGICFSSFDCTFAHIRGKEVGQGAGPLTRPTQDPWNSIMSGAAAGAVMAARQVTCTCTGTCTCTCRGRSPWLGPPWWAACCWG